MKMVMQMDIHKMILILLVGDTKKINKRNISIIVRKDKNMTTESMINELRRLSEKHKNDRVSTCETRWSDLCKDVADRLEELTNNKEKNISMSTEEMIKALKILQDTHKKDKVGTCEIRWSDLCRDVSKRLEELSTCA